MRVHSSKSLKDRINCNGNVVVRDTLTDKEKQQEIEKFKKEHKSEWCSNCKPIVSVADLMITLSPS